MPPLTAVAMSGGLDSSVTAWLLASAGEPVVGLSMGQTAEELARCDAACGSRAGTASPVLCVPRVAGNGERLVEVRVGEEHFP